MRRGIGHDSHLLQELCELASDVGSVAIQHWCVTSAHLTGVVQDNDLGVERVGTLGRVALGVTSNIATTNFLDGNVLDVETNVVSWKTLCELLVVHLNRLDFGGDVGWSKSNDLRHDGSEYCLV